MKVMCAGRQVDVAAAPRPDAGHGAHDGALAAARLAADQHALGPADLDLGLGHQHLAVGPGDAELAHDQPVVVGRRRGARCASRRRPRRCPRGRSAPRAGARRGRSRRASRRTWGSCRSASESAHCTLEKACAVCIRPPSWICPRGSAAGRRSAARSARDRPSELVSSERLPWPRVWRCQAERRSNSEPRSRSRSSVSPRIRAMPSACSRARVRPERKSASRPWRTLPASISPRPSA